MIWAEEVDKDNYSCSMHDASSTLRLSRTEKLIIMSPRLATQSDVARMAGTSTAVVSYVVNGGPRPVAAKTRERVLAAIEKTGYRPNNVARTLLTGKSSTFGMVIPDLANPFLSHMVQCIEDKFFELGYSLIIADSHDDLVRERRIIETMISQQVAGLIWYSVDQPSPVDLVKDMAQPVAFMNACYPVKALGGAGKRISVLEDECGAAAELTGELIERGCTTIGLLSGPEGRINSAERSRGWLHALGDDDHRNPESHPLYLSAPYTHKGGWEVADQFLRLGCDGIVASNEMQAVGIMSRIAALGLSIPEDVSIVAMHGTPHAQFYAPALSAMHINMQNLVDKLHISLLEKNTPEVIIPSLFFVERASCFSRNLCSR